MLVILDFELVFGVWSHLFRNKLHVGADIQSHLFKNKSV